MSPSISVDHPSNGDNQPVDASLKAQDANKPALVQANNLGSTIHSDAATDVTKSGLSKPGAIPRLDQLSSNGAVNTQEDGDKEQLPLSHWISHISANRPVEFISDKSRKDKAPKKTRLIEFTVERQLGEATQAFCREYDFTALAVLLSAFRVAHYRLTNASDSLLSIAADSMTQETSAQALGFMGDLQFVPTSIDEDNSFEQVVLQVQKSFSSPESRHKISSTNLLAKIGEIDDVSARPRIPTLFALHLTEQGKFTPSEYDETSLKSMFDIEFHLFQEAQNLRGSILYCDEMYHPATMHGIASVFQSVIKSGIVQPTIPVIALPLLTDDDYSILDSMGLVQVNQVDYPRDASVIDVFSQQVAAFPSGIAVKDSTTQLTYSQLDSLSDKVALWLSSRGYAVETMIGVLADRTCETVAVFLGILKANMAYLPFDVRSPASRIETILSSISHPRLVLVGNNLNNPTIQLTDVEFVPFKHATEGITDSLDIAPTIKPSATSLAYVMFTSGSTGAPKGVAIEHRGIVRLVKESNIAKQLPDTITMAHLSNVAFDAATWEIYGAILNGGTVICIDSATVLDYRAVNDVFAREQISSAFITTALFKNYTHDCPTIISGLGMLCFGGEKFDLQDLAPAQKVMTGNLVHVYGPTENTTFSTMYPVLNQDYPNGLPIGHTLSNSGACVMDVNQRLVPLGVVGELVVLGDGLSRGYTESKLNQNRFISIEVKGQQARAYRTGDLVRYRPTDGQLEYFGRLDGQVKIRGNRVELSEIEHMMRSHEHVHDAAAVLKRDDGQEAYLTAFATIRVEDKPNAETDGTSDAGKQIQMWREFYDSDVYLTMSSMSLEKIGRDFTGWTSMYDGNPINPGEMNEWLDDTVNTILSRGQPGHVLEIGTGSGMILYNLGNQLESYVGLDLSKAAIETVAKTLASTPALAEKVRLYNATADEVRHLDIPVAPDLVIVNSVLQYFPSQAYLFQAIQDVLELGAKKIYLGDVRSHALHQDFLASRALRLFGDSISKEDMRSQIAAEESELLVDPGFFTSLRDRLPGLVGEVEIMPKKMRATNELSCYRYAAIIYAKDQTQQEKVRSLDEETWVDFRKSGLDRQSLLQLLKSASESSTVGVSNIPYSKTILERFVVDHVDKMTNGTSDSTGWISTIRQAAQDCPSLAPVDLIEIGQESGHDVEISWARQYSQRGGFDAIFHHHDPASQGKGMTFRFPVDHDGRELDSFSTQPLRVQLKRDVQKHLNEKLRSQLPSYMIPKEIRILDHLPVNMNGKVDRKALEQMVTRSKPSGKSGRQPTTEAERQMKNIWAEALKIKINTFGLDDNFFDLGGDSLVAMRIVGLARHVGFELTIQDIFRNRDIGKLCAQLSFDSEQTVIEPVKIDLIDPVTKNALLEKIDRLNLGVGSSSIEDIYPITNIQKEFLYCPTAWRQYIDYFYMDLDHRPDVSCFEKNCALTLERYPTLRTHFVQILGQYWQLILHKIDSPVRIVDVDGELESSFSKYVLDDLRELSEDQPALRIFYFRHGTHGTRLAVRMQHAQNDAISIPIIFKSLLSAHEQEPSSIAPSFYHYMSYISQKREMAISYWKEFLRGSHITEIKPKICPDSPVEEPKPLAARAKTALPTLPDKSIMVSTLVNAAWALYLSRLTGESDVVFWQFVSGRNSAIRGVEGIVGACMSAAPVRVPFSSFETPLQLLEFIQDQLMAHGEADSLGKDMVEECTDWPSGLFDSIIQHQSFGETPSLDCFGADRPIRFFENPYLLEPYPWISTFARDGYLHVDLYSTTGLVTAAKADRIVEDIANIAARFSSGLNSPLSAWMDEIQLTT